jgi:hypothetical protein
MYYRSTSGNGRFEQKNVSGSRERKHNLINAFGFLKLLNCSQK